MERFRAILPGHAEPVESESAGREVWIHVRCRARHPAEAPTAWIDLADHPAQPPAPHWASDPIGFILTLVRHGEFEAIWHDVTKREVMSYSPSLADRVARSTDTHTVEEIAAEIVDVIRNPPED